MLDKIKSPKQVRGKTRKGRGMSSGRGGHTVGRGQKGQKSRAGYSSPRPGFEGGAMPLSRRIPKLKGFSRGFITARERVVVLNVGDLAVFEEGTKVTKKELSDKGFVRTKSQMVSVKVLSNGNIKKKLHLIDIATSKEAKKKIEKAGGTVLEKKHK